MSDTHFTPPHLARSGVWWNRTTENHSGKMGDALIRRVQELAPDFVIHCGDFTGVCSHESFILGESIMNHLGCPWFAVPGNHDTWCGDVRNQFASTFGTSSSSCSYARKIGGLRFFFLDVAHWYYRDGSITSVLDHEAMSAGNLVSFGPVDDDLDRLERDLARDSIPTVLVTHAPVDFRKGYPASTLPKGKPVTAPLTSPDEIIPPMSNSTRLRNIIRDSSTIKACFAGHWHINDAVDKDGVWYIQTGALREYPYEIRLVDYSDGTMSISTHGLDVPDLIKESFVTEWNNRWIAGADDVRSLDCNFR
ncbi:metallophosphoesterase family protein [Candidatus Latescibacterota bacterium]